MTGVGPTSALLPILHHRPPRLYRVSRLLRRISLIVLVVVLLYLGSSVYSAVRLVESSAPSEKFSTAFAENDTVEIQGSVSISNPGYYPVSGFDLSLRVLNRTGTLLGVSRSGPTEIPAGNSTSFPVAIYVPAVAGSAAGSLLVADQPLTAIVWANASYAYLIPISVHVVQNRSWGAPFDSLRIAPGSVTNSGGSAAVSVTVSFLNHAPFADQGTLAVTLDSSSSAVCGSLSLTLNVPPGGDYDQNASVPIASGCPLPGGSILASYTSSGIAVQLPTEALT